MSNEIVDPCGKCGRAEKDHGPDDIYDHNCDGYDVHPTERLELPHHDEDTGQKHCFHPITEGEHKGDLVCCWCGDIYLGDRVRDPGEHGPYVPKVST